MKVLFCAYDRPGHLATGPNAWLQRLVPDLHQNYGLDIHTLFIYGGLLEDCPTINYFNENKLPVSLINRDSQPYIADQVKALLRIVKSQNIHAVVANLVIPAFYATRYLKRFNIPVIGVMHSQDSFYKGVIAKFVQGNEEDRLATVVSVSDYIHSLVTVQPPVVTTKVIACGTPMGTIKADWNGNVSLRVIYAGRLVIEAKQILKLTTAFCEAAKNNPRMEFSIYGDGEEEIQVQELIKGYDLRAQVLQHQALPPNQILATIGQHQVFTLMSDYEGMPVALMEAMACGVVPVCLAETSGINEIIEHGVNGFIVKDRGADYQRHLQLLLEDKNLWQRLSHNAINTIKERYSSAKTHKQWFELLNSFKDVQTKQIKLPKRIKLEGELLYYGDTRKPTFRNRLLNNLKQQWMNLRLFVRPRARLRALIKK